MNKAIIAIATLGLLSGSAVAQSNIAIYGVADAGLVRETGGPAGGVTALASGVGSGSRIGFKGKEDLGGGTVALFVIENGYNIDTGAAAQGGLLFGRQAYVGLANQLGTVTLGRQTSPYYRALRDVADPFSTGWAGRADNIMANNTRLNNMVQYASPNLRGLVAELAVGFGETPGDSARNRAYSTAVSYANGPLTVALSWHQLQNATATDHAANTLLAAKYRVGVVEGNLGYAWNRGLGGADSTDLLLGVSVPFGGASKVFASYIRRDDDTAANRDASQWGVGYTYSLSKRTDLYAAYARISNRNGATFKVGNATGDGTGKTGLNLGVRHCF
ncbi:porin [Pseudoduganella namucuonensis]|uniref:Outer membrane protein (Porin) n=1 Tax=Pseudoduganella namucuonensis TaxID=1035707 RepID=A0A1I7LN59_9BURK|nr:porin [Pseudoduganella namucuonensis]SFV11094.1 Outer membrane protein (porin) [Pseudoduganella namucuonensis]